MLPRTASVRSSMIIALLALMAWFRSGPWTSQAPHLYLGVCEELKPTPGNIAYWPHTHPPGGPPPANSSVHRVWRLEICRGAAPGFLVSGSGAAFNRPPPGCTGCEGTFLISRVAGCPVLGSCISDRVAKATNAVARPLSCSAPLAVEPLPSLAAHEDAWELGPDELFVLLEGAELLKLKGTHVGGCRYAFPFTATIPGVFRLVAVALRADWASLSEHVAGFPPLTLDNIAGDKLLVTLGDAAATEPTRAAVLRASVACALNATAVPNLGCGGGSLHGRWVRTAPTTNLFEPAAPWWAMPIRAYPNGIGIRYFSELHAQLLWVPHGCCAQPLADLAGEAARQCLSHSSFRLRGDSQLRMVYNHLMNAACGISGASRLTGSLCAATSPSHGACPGLLSCYEADLIGDNASWTPPALPDRLFINFGQHPASGRYRVPLGAYERSLAAYFGTLPQKGARGAAAAWVDTFPLCTRNDMYVHSFGDWRTGHRIELYNRAASRAIAPHVRSGRLLHVRAFDMVDALTDLCPDNAHLVGIDSVLDPLSMTLLDTLCETAKLR
jgi:hypothetical protein